MIPIRLGGRQRPGPQGRQICHATISSKMLEFVHGAYQGLELTLRRARRAIFWPKMKDEIEVYISACTPCAKDAPNQKDTLPNYEIPNHPWSKVGADFLSFKGKDYLVLIDYHSNYLEFEEVEPATSGNTIKFVRVGVPFCLQTDNGS